MVPGNPQPLLLGVPEVVKALGLGRSTVLKMLYAGTVPSVRVGTRRLVRAADLQAYVAGLADLDANR
jgi:excisionase family DNA binding protein